ncbi:MAG: fused MFS/spermidine synthase, partial [Candidatus Aminicenantes bacterium]
MERALTQQDILSPEFPEKGASTLIIRSVIYVLFFFSGAAALVYEILWTRQFVLVFGNSSYAISTVLAAFMAGLGIGSWWFGRYTDRHRHRLLLYSLLEGGIALSAFIVPFILHLMEKIMPALFSSAASSIPVISLIRFMFSFLILFIPCFLIGGTLPVLGRYCVEKLRLVGPRISLLYGLNTLGAAGGCLASGFVLIETLGLEGTNHLAVTINLSVAAAAVLVHFLGKRKTTEISPEPKKPQNNKSRKKKEKGPSAGNSFPQSIRNIFLLIAFVTGFVSLSLEVLWTRYLSFRIPSNAYNFPSILGVFLVGLGLGSLVYRLFLAQRQNQGLILAGVLILSGPLILVMLFAASKLAQSYGLRILPFSPIHPAVPAWTKLQSLNIAAVTIFLPTILMGMAFPALCTVFTQNIKKVGESIGKVYAVNTAGSITGSLLPVLAAIPLFGLRTSLLAMAVLTSFTGVWLYSFSKMKNKKWCLVQAAASLLALILLFPLFLPRNLSKDLFLSTLQLGKHNQIIFYKEGKTATSILVQDKVSRLKDLYINSVEEVPTSFAARYCFKLMGILGVLLHPHPSEVLMICFGGGIAAGATVQHPEVRSLEVVDIEASVIEAAGHLSRENNRLLQNPKLHVVVEDGRNYLFMSGKKYPLIISDSTHPKSADSWVLYTREFYQAVRESLTENGVFVQWLPFHHLTTQEYKIILHTFQSVFPHTSLWLTHAIDEMGRFMKFSLLAATPDTLTIDLQDLKQKLSYPAVQKDLKPWDLNHPVGILRNFLANEERIRRWTRDVPVNTDNLPWSYYHTPYSLSQRHDLKSFLPVVESIWPYLDDRGDQEKRAELKQKLKLLFQGKKMILQGKIKEAFALLPQDKKTLKEKENIRESIRYLKQVSAFYPQDAMRLLWLARGLRTMITLGGDKDQGKLKDVIPILEKALKADPDHVEARLELAGLLLNLGKAEEAASHYQEVLKLQPNSLTAFARLGSILNQQGKPQEALKHLRRALRIDPLNARVKNNLASSLIQLGRLDEAVKHLEEALRIDPRDVKIHSNLGAALLNKGKIDEAVARFKEAMRIDPYHVKTKVNLAQALIRKREYGQAIDILYQVQQLDPQDARSRYNLAFLLLRENRYKEAMETLEQGIALSPDQVLLLDLLARLLLSVPDRKLRDREQALNLAQRACRLSHERNPRCLDTLAGAYASMGRYEEASETALKAYRL